MSRRKTMGTLNVWRWYWRSPIDSYTTANWARWPSIAFDGNLGVHSEAPSRIAGKRFRFVSIHFHTKCWRIGMLPIKWKLETVIDFIEENGGYPAVPSSPAILDPREDA